MTQILSVLPSPSELSRGGRGRSRAFGLAASLGTAILLWLGQLGVAALDPGFAAGWSIEWLAGSLAPAILAAVLVWQRSRGGAASRMLSGGLAGGALALAHLMTLSGSGAAAPARPFAVAAALAIGLATGAALGRLASFRRNLIGAVSAGMIAASGLVLAHLAAAFAFAGAVPAPWLELAAGGVLLAALGALAGTRLAELGLLETGTRADTRERFRTLAETLPIPVVLTTVDSEQIIFANERSREQFLVPEGTAAQRPCTDGFYNDLADRRKLAALVARDGAVEGHEVEMRRADGSTFWALTAARGITFDGERGILAGYYDITDRKAAEEALLASEVRYALISRAANDGIWDWDIPSGTVYYSARWREIVGAESGKRLSTLDDWFGRLHPDDVMQLKCEIDEHIAGRTAQLDTEYRIRHGDGRYCWMQCRGIVLRGNDGVPIRMAGSQSDITLRKTYEINLRNAAYEDRLTGVSNRAFFTHLVDTRTTEDSIRGSAILLLNVDQFRRINDSLGTGAGDALLIAIARRLAARIKPHDALSRLGSDEFAVWLHDIADHEAALRIAEAMLADLDHPYALGELQTPVTVSAGLAAPTLGGAASGADLLHNARLALDRAKHLGGGQCALFDDALLRESKLRQRLSRDLAVAGRLGQIFFEYQPVVTLDPGGVDTVAGFEALMRWRHPELGLIPPGRFIPLAEEGGMIGALGMLAIEQAAQQIGRWTGAGLTPTFFSIAVNLSARQVSDQASVQRLYALLDRLTLPAGRLKLEITESVLMSDPEAMATTFQELRDRGVELSLDDFGTGYSSLSYLHRFPLNVLKIDRSFVTRMCRAPEAMRLVKSIVELAHDLGLAVVAEGVESAEETECLRGLGCDYAQGYFFSEPVSADRAGGLLARRVF